MSTSVYKKWSVRLCSQTFQRGLLILTLSIGIVFPSLSHSDNVDKTKLLKIEAAYLYKFTKFIKWPDFRFKHSSNLNLCLVGEDLSELNRLLSKGISGKQSNGRTLHVYYYSGSTISAERNCHLIYLDSVAAESLSDQIDESATLLISSPNNPHTDNSLIFLKIQNGKLIFYVNQQRLDASLLEFNAALLSIARRKL